MTLEQALTIKTVSFTDNPLSQHIKENVKTSNRLMTKVT